MVTFPCKWAVTIAVLFLCLAHFSLAHDGNESTSDRPSLFIVPQLDGTLVALDAISGKPMWNFSTGGPLLQSSEPSISSIEVSLFNTIQREGFQDIYAEAKSVLGATPFMSLDGTIYLSHKTSKLFGLDPHTGEVIVPKAKSDGTQLLTEEPICKSSLQIVRTEHTLESHNDSTSHFLTMAHLRVFLRDCSGEEVLGKGISPALPMLTATPVGDLQAYDKNGSLLWLYVLPSTPSSIVYALSSNSLHIVHPQLPPRLATRYPLHSLSNYKGTPFEGTFAIEHTKTLALPAPPEIPDPSKKIWLWVTSICVCTAAAIWGLVILRHQSGKPQTPTQPTSAHQQSESIQRLHAEHQELHKQLSELRQLQEQQAQSPPQMPLRISSSEGGWSRYRTDFDEKERLGEGGFGTVFRATNKLDGVEYAVKKVCLAAGNPMENDRVLREVRHLAQLDHPNIIRYYQSWMEEDEWDGNAAYEDEQESSNGEGDKSKSGNDKIKLNDDMESTVEASVDYEGDESKLGGTTSCSSGDSMEGSSKDTSHNTSGLKSLSGTKDSMDITFESTSKHATQADGADGGMDVTFERMYGSTSESYTSKDYKVRKRASTSKRRTILYIQMQYCHQGTLQQWLARSTRVVCDKEALSIFHFIVKGVVHIHNNRMIHRDLKPANILISADGNVKICDFGLSTGSVVDNNGSIPYLRLLAHSHTMGVGSPFYCSPEQLSGARYDSKVDIFSLGIILYEMLHIFSTQMERVTHITELRDGCINVQTRETYPELSELVLQLVQFNPDLRPPASEILAHPLIADITTT